MLDSPPTTVFLNSLLKGISIVFISFSEGLGLVVSVVFKLEQERTVKSIQTKNSNLRMKGLF
jgi:hypothetical protein